MLSISPTSAAVVSAVPTAASIFALPGGRYGDEKPAPPPNAKLIKSTGGGLATLTADDIPYPADWDEPSSHPHKSPFVHVPTITLMRGDKSFVVTGPVEPVMPRMTEATQAGWERWLGDLAAHDAQSTAAGAAAHRAVKTYFETRSAKQEADREAKYKRACDRAFRRGQPAPPRPVYKPPPDNWTMFIKDPELRANMRAASYFRYNARRLRRYVHTRGPVADRDTARFIEEFKKPDGSPSKAFRTALNIISFQLLSSALPKSLVYGYDKTTVFSASISGTSGMDARDMEYIESDRYRRSLFVVDLDGWWASIEQLRRDLRRLLPPEFMPNLIVCRGSEEKGGVENPHLFWMLPPGARVCLENGKSKQNKNKKKQFNLHSMVQKGIVSLLIPIGADPDHHNVWKFKNPLSPKWSVAACDDSFPTMSEWRSFLPTITPDQREMKRRAKVVKAARLGVDPDDVTLSSAVFNDGVTSRRLLIRAAQACKDPAFLKAVETSHAAFVDWLYHPVDGNATRRLIKIHGDTPAVRSVLKAQREFVVELKLTPKQASQWYNHGRDAALNEETLPAPGWNATAEERKAWRDARKGQGGTYTQLNKLALHCGLISEEIESRIAAGVPVVKSEVVNALVKAGTVKRSTAYNHFDYCLQIVQQAPRYQAVHLETPSSSSCQPVEATPDSIPETVSVNETTDVEPKDTPVTVAPVLNPPHPYRQAPPWVVDKGTLTRWQEACRIREMWRLVVDEWRSATQHLHDGDLVDLDEDDPMIRAAMLLDRSAWSHHRRH
ncbi:MULTISPECIES: hypothetical protein [unclassified Bradyrhizobium]|uniref:hypothetical protein n=1 Tax=unclassified Bradyrhizobium TaxID=2631580 RepID=UPI002FF1A220